ncbi:MAG: hypothetical protein IKQ67_06370 [Candidatus Methanomethylophilaceae archaeon]|nr:hypothetical protein [Candidatus Methanomethylophilaceae archaeon]
MNLDEELEAYYKKLGVEETIPMLANIIIGIMERDSISFDVAFSLGFDEEYRDLIRSEVERRNLNRRMNYNERKGPRI